MNLSIFTPPLRDFFCHTLKINTILAYDYINFNERDDMSGSGGIGSGGWGGGSSATPCESLAFETQLSSPKANVIQRLTLGDVLEIELKTVDETITIVISFNGEVAGGLSSPDVQRLRECILSGHEYVATVLSINQGQVKVRVKAVTQ